MVVDLCGIPHLNIESGFAAMQMVWSVVGSELIVLAVELELSFGNAVAVASG